ncbi:hypothetical protein M0813_24996 [Anaeramoeba flamelloides]|uniref:Uncharacterized protein n=1 Tax=Anaeramoeba flamelloides TaxID=1746091 RepID=A0ABQ8Y486_9EUKA|nr:hypothetical protein M0813_24996 [Anaeramoeba flamelloides]
MNEKKNCLVSTNSNVGILVGMENKQKNVSLVENFGSVSTIQKEEMNKTDPLNIDNQSNCELLQMSIEEREEILKYLRTNMKNLDLIAIKLFLDSGFGEISNSKKRLIILNRIYDLLKKDDLPDLLKLKLQFDQIFNIQNKRKRNNMKQGGCYQNLNQINGEQEVGSGSGEEENIRRGVDNKQEKQSEIVNGNDDQNIDKIENENKVDICQTIVESDKNEKGQENSKVNKKSQIVEVQELNLKNNLDLDYIFKYHDLIPLRKKFKGLSGAIIESAKSIILNNILNINDSLFHLLNLSFDFWDETLDKEIQITHINPNIDEIKIIKKFIYNFHFRLKKKIINYITNYNVKQTGEYIKNGQRCNIIDDLVVLCRNELWFKHCPKLEQKAFVKNIFIQWYRDNYSVNGLQIESFLNEKIRNELVFNLEDFNFLKNNLIVDQIGVRTVNRKRKKLKYTYKGITFSKKIKKK